MTGADQPASDSPGVWQMDDDLNEAVEQMQPGDEVRIDDRDNLFTVTEKTDVVIGSDAHPTHVAVLEARGRTYRLRGPYQSDDDYTSPPSLEIQTSNGWNPVTSAISQLVIENWAERIAADISAAEYVEDEFEVETFDPINSSDGVETTLVSATDYNPVGKCPDCGSTVVGDGEQVVCTGCDRWCWRAQWDAYQSDSM